ncbi:MAG: hypothetical protein OXU62_07025 [Gammaproteobacteria bacterium]|nr:hypothetical protein [Gammaproteobacteria bacterium]
MFSGAPAGGFLGAPPAFFALRHRRRKSRQVRGDDGSGIDGDGDGDRAQPPAKKMAWQVMPRRKPP